MMILFFFIIVVCASELSLLSVKIETIKCKDRKTNKYNNKLNSACFFKKKIVFEHVITRYFFLYSFHVAYKCNVVQTLILTQLYCR